MQAVPRMKNMFKEFLLKVVLSQFKRLNLTVSEGSIVWQCHSVQNNAYSMVLESLHLIALCSGQIVVPWHAAICNDEHMIDS